MYIEYYRMEKMLTKLTPEDIAREEFASLVVSEDICIEDLASYLKNEMKSSIADIIKFEDRIISVLRKKDRKFEEMSELDILNYIQNHRY